MRFLLLVLTAVMFFSTAEADVSGAVRKEISVSISKIKSLGSFESGWEATEFRGEKAASSLNGHIYVSGKKVYVSTPSRSIWYDGHTQWSLSPASDEVYVSTPTVAEAAKLNPLSFISIPLNVYSGTLSRSSLRGESAINIDLKANASGGARWKYIYLTLSASTHLPLCVRFSADGSRWTRISLYSLKGGRRFPSSLFVFPKEKYSNAEIIDLR